MVQVHPAPLFMKRSRNYDPNHPAEPSPPTFWNRVRCRLHGHFLHLDYIDIHNKVHLICLRCSIILVASWPRANVVVSETVQEH